MGKIKFRSWFTLVLVMVVVFIFVPFGNISVYADDTNLGRTPDGIFPLQENDVIMESEEITVDLEKNKVECVFVFHNTGKKKNVYMGFPGQLSGLNHENVNVVNLNIKNFKTFVKGKELPVAHEKNIEKNALKNLNMQDYSEFFTFTIPFQENEKITVRNTYDYTPTHDSIGNVYGGYVLETGAMWKGNIGSAKVIFKLGNIKPYQIEKLNPGGFKFKGNTLVWERNDFEPKYNLSITYNVYKYNPDFNLNATETQKREVYLKKNNYDLAERLASKNDTEGLVALYNKAVKEYNSTLALYIASLLPPNKVVEENTKIDNIEFEKGRTYCMAKCNILGQEPVNIQAKVSRLENGKVVEELTQEGFDYYYFNEITPGTEYNITFTITDWLEQTTYKTIKYKIPDEETTSTEELVNDSDSALDASTATPSSTDNTEIATEASTSSSVGSENTTATDTDALAQNGSTVKVVIGLLFVIALVVGTVVFVKVMRRKEQE